MLMNTHQGIDRSLGYGRDGLITGYVLKLARESTGLSQPALADQLSVDAHTLQSWETGRRSMAGTHVRDFVQLRLRLLTLGAAPVLVESLDAALAADHILAYILQTDPESADPARHPLATLLLPWGVSNMLSWPLLGTPPATLATDRPRMPRRGPVSPGPLLASSDRLRFFEHLRLVGDRLRRLPSASHDHRALFTHQAYYRLGWQRTPESTRWLHRAYQAHSSRAGWASHWSEEWLAVRALVLALACHGDPEPLRLFIASGHQTDEAQFANLNYWAYWMGEISQPQHSHHFMPSGEVFSTWSGTAVLTHLVRRLDDANPYVELNIHSIAALLNRPVTRQFIEHDAPLRAALHDASEHLLAVPDVLSPHAQRQLLQLRVRLSAPRPTALGVPPSMSPDELDAVARYFYEVGHLKLSKRAGWWQAGVPQPESIAEHSFRTAVIGYVLAVLEGADANLTATICLFHDVPEARLGDIPNVVARTYVTRASEIDVARDQVQGAPEHLAKDITGLVANYRMRESKEAQLAKDADRLECILQAREYEHQGFKNTRPWVQSNLAKLQSRSARRLAEHALDLSPTEWLTAAFQHVRQHGGVEPGEPKGQPSDQAESEG
jgi:5'-deoxynucleotidase YfbR-like HD superfamily hydrolase/transcriptional regulator with XRE-family HTH domain